MEFKEYSEFEDPLQKDYDIKTSIYVEEEFIDREKEAINDALLEIVGIPEDVTDDEFFDEWGFTWEEFLNPTWDTVEKARKRKNQNNSKAKQM